MLTKRDLDMILACVSQMLQEQHIPIGEHGVAVATTWAPQDNAALQVEAGTVQVTSGKTAAIIGDDGDTGFAKAQVSVGTFAVGDQYGVVGNERVVMLHTEAGGPIAVFIHGADDTPQAPAGERWTFHYDPKKILAATATYVANAWRKFTNDGKTAGDNKGGYRVLVGGYGTFQTTNGFLIALDDTGNLISITSPGGGSIKIDDTAQQLKCAYGSASFLLDGATGTFQIDGSGDSTPDGIMRKSDGQALSNAIMSEIDTWAKANFTSGSQGSGWNGAGPIPPTATASTDSLTA